MQQPTVTLQSLEQRIFLIRGQKVMLDFHLAGLYGVESKALKRAVRRNIDRFPSDFCFELSIEEERQLRYHIGASKILRGKNTVGKGGRRYPPFAFTEQGVAMLSSVLRSNRAVLVNIEIMRAFVRLRQILATNKDLAAKLDQLETKYDSKFKVVFEAIRRLMIPPEKPKRKIGF